MNVYVRSNGKIFGPVDFSKVSVACQEGLFTENAEISEDRIEWLSLGEAQDLLKPKNAAKAPLPVIPEAGSFPASPSPMAVPIQLANTMDNQSAPLVQQPFAAIPPHAYASPEQQPIFLNSMQNMIFAGFWLRVVAVIIDGIVMCIPNLCVNLVIAILLANSGYSLKQSLSMYTIIGQLVGLIYYAGMESSSMQGTFGKKAVGIKVTDLSGRPISFSRACGRFFGKILSSCLLCFGLFMVAFTDKKQGLHDMLAGCLVVRREQQ